jgi:hypothetical protein
VGSNFKEDEAWEGTVLVDIISAEESTVTNSRLIFLKWYEARSQAFSYLGVAKVSNADTVEALEYEVLSRLGAKTYRMLKAEKELSNAYAALDLGEDFLSANVAEGDVVVWMDSVVEGAEFPSASAYVKFNENKVNVRIVNAESLEEVGVIPLLKDMTYTAVQTQFGEFLKVDPQKVRLIVHDPQTGGPDVVNVKNKANSGYKLEWLLNTSAGAVDRLYYDVCNEKVTILDTMDSFSFSVLDERLQPAVKGIKRSFFPPSKTPTPSILLSLVKESIGPEFCQKLGPLRVIQATKGTIDDVVLSEDDPKLPTIAQRAQVSAVYVYRVEPCPRPLEPPGIPQTLIDFTFFYFSGTHSHVERRGDPFSMYLLDSDTAPEVVERLRQKFGFTKDASEISLYTLAYNAAYYPPMKVTGAERVVSALKKASGYKVHIGMEVSKTGPLF